MNKPKKVKLGNVISEKKQRQDGTSYVSTFIALGSQNNRDPKYNTTVEIVVKDSQGNVLSRQVNGFIEVSNPRTKPGELLSANIIDEATYDSMMEKALRIPDKIKNELHIKTT